MNLLHRWYCSSNRWAGILRGHLLPWIMDDVDLGGDVLEIGPGPGLATDWLRTRIRKLTSIEVDHRLAEALRGRLGNTNVTVVEGDATAMPFPDASFSGAVCFTMLHHVPSSALQDRLLAETCRVLRPGGVFAGSDSTRTLLWSINHLFDTGVPVDPDTLAGRLEGAGFEDVAVAKRGSFFRFRGRRPRQATD